MNFDSRVPYGSDVQTDQWHNITTLNSIQWRTSKILCTILKIQALL